MKYLSASSLAFFAFSLFALAIAGCEQSAKEHLAEESDQPLETLETLFNEMCSEGLARSDYAPYFSETCRYRETIPVEVKVDLLRQWIKVKSLEEEYRAARRD